MRKYSHYLLAVLTVLLAASTPAPAQRAGTGHISGAATYELTNQMLSVAPKRFNGSPGHLAAEQFLKTHFAPEAAKGDFETDQFTTSTPAGMQTMRNYIVRYPGKKDGIIVLASHYETNYNLRTINFMGANDGACTSALLMEIGVYLRTHPPQGYSVWLVFDDGEESVSGDWSSSDSLYGTRHLAARWSQNGTLAKIKAFIVADMIGDKDLNIDRDENSTPELESLLQQAAKNIGHPGMVFKNDVGAIQDDHLPFKQRGVPVLDVIDIDYGPKTAAAPDGYHHTSEDTIDHISAQSLQLSGDLFLEVMRLIDQH
jgi:Zn-dependent M28 family amino/carboxypeptidase